MRVARTDRGFAVARGHDRYGQPFSIQDSSLAGEACIWLGSDAEEGGRAHLTQVDAAALIPLLAAFVHGGSIAAEVPPSSSWKAMWDALRDEIINTPETADFMAAVPLEAAHQRARWPSDHDAGKSPFDWFWLLGYLAQKAADAAVRGDVEKARHHTISSAAALANWHAALTGTSTAMRPGIDPEGAA